MLEEGMIFERTCFLIRVCRSRFWLERRYFGRGGWTQGSHVYSIRSHNITVQQVQIDWLVAWDDSEAAFRRAGIKYEPSRVLLNLDRVGEIASMLYICNQLNIQILSSLSLH